MKVQLSWYETGLALRLFKKVMVYAKPYIKTYYAVLISAILLSLFSTLNPYLLKITVDDYITPRNFDGLMTFIFVMLIVLLLEVVFQYVFVFYANWLGQMIIKDIRVSLFKKLISFKMMFFDKSAVGRLVTRSVNDIESIANIFSQGLFMIFADLLKMTVVVIVMVIITRLAMSPVQYKMYVGQAKMKILRPEITAATEKYKDDPMKRNQETMKIYNQAGANPLSGCVPALLQLPVFYALFCFFPVAFALREESFLWADDLSSYDVIAELPFYIPFYGDHISLFPITAAIAMFFYTRMSGSQQMQPQQPGMPNMKFIMYVIPFTLLIFFNNFASGLSLYYTVSNILTILIMLTIKNLILDEKKILATIEEKKKQPTTENRFQRRMRKMQEMMEEAEKKQKLKRKR